MTLTITLENEIEKDGELLLHTPHWTEAEFYEFCQRNDLLRVERTAEGDVSVMAPSDGFTDNRNAEIIGDLIIWNRALQKPGMVFGATAGFTLPNGAVRSPDAAWVAIDRWNAIPSNLRNPFPHIAPDFVVELMSPSDRLKKAQEKMEEYIANGVRLGWLIDRARRTVFVYRQGAAVETLADPTTVSGDPELPGLTVNMARILLDIIP